MLLYLFGYSYNIEAITPHVAVSSPVVQIRFKVLILVCDELSDKCIGTIICLKFTKKVQVSKGGVASSPKGSFISSHPWRWVYEH